MPIHLQPTFEELMSRHSARPQLIEMLWTEIVQRYSEPHRHYHTLTHLGAMIFELEPIREQIRDFDVMLFSVFYHDIVYEVMAIDNEEQSAMLARKRLAGVIDDERIEAVSAQITATKTHRAADEDTAFLLDADLSVLGKDEQTYRNYADQIRREFAIVPDAAYREGRKSVLTRFLTREAIYHTPLFAEKYERQARTNLALEIQTLSK